MKRGMIPVALLVLAMLAMTCCGNKESGSTPAVTSTDVPETSAPAETEYLDTLPATDLSGRPFMMLIEDRYGNGMVNTHTGSETGEIVNDALYRRDVAAEELLDVKFEYETTEKRAEIVSKVKNAVSAGDEVYHTAMGSITSGTGTLATQMMLYDLAALPHVSLDKPWWVTTCNEQLFVGDFLYFAASPIVTTFFATPFAICFNKDMAADLKLPDLYSEVTSGTWTIDRMAEFAKGVSRDLDANGVMDNKDQYGIATHTSGLWGYYASSGIAPLIINRDRTFTLTLGSERSVGIIDRLSHVLSDRKQVYYYDGSNPSHADMFLNGQVLFEDYSVTGFIITFRDMEDDWGILPIPKTFAEQEGYHTTLQTLLPCGICVPKNCSKPEETGLILEVLAYLSNKDIREAAYDTLLTGKVTRDENSVKMLDIIYGDINIDLLYVYRFANVLNCVNASIVNGDPFVSAYESIRTSLENEIRTFISSVE